MTNDDDGGKHASFPNLSTRIVNHQHLLAGQQVSSDVIKHVSNIFIKAHETIDVER